MAQKGYYPKAYTRWSRRKLEESARQLHQIYNHIVDNPGVTFEELRDEFEISPNDLNQVLRVLFRDDMIESM